MPYGYTNINYFEEPFSIEKSNVNKLSANKAVYLLIIKFAGILNTGVAFLSTILNSTAAAEKHSIYMKVKFEHTEWAMLVIQWPIARSTFCLIS